MVGKRTVKCGKNTLNTPYQEGLTGTMNAGYADIYMTSAKYGTIVYYVSAGYIVCINVKNKGVWSGWKRLDSADLDGIDITCPNQSTVVGTDDKSVPNNTITDLYSFSLNPGIYILEFQVSWKSNADGVRTLGIAFSDTDVIAMNNMSSSIVQPVDGDTTRQSIVYFTAPTSKVNYTVRAKQTSGSALTCRLRMGMIKLKKF